MFIIKKLLTPFLIPPGIFVALALCLAAGASFREAAYLANHAAGIVVGKRGTATVTADELKRVL